MQFMWAFVTIIVSQITFHSSGIFLPLPFSAPVIRLSHFVFLQISQMADDTAAELDRHLAVKTRELLGWKSPRGQQCSQAQFLVGPMGGKLAPLYPIHTEGCPHALGSPWKAQPSSGTLLIPFLLSPVHPICSGPSGLGGPQRVSVADRGPFLGPSALTVTSPSCQDHWQAWHCLRLTLVASFSNN